MPPADMTPRVLLTGASQGIGKGDSPGACPLQIFYSGPLSHKAGGAGQSRTICRVRVSRLEAARPIECRGRGAVRRVTGEYANSRVNSFRGGLRLNRTASGIGDLCGGVAEGYRDELHWPVRSCVLHVAEVDRKFSGHHRQCLFGRRYFAGNRPIGLCGFQSRPACDAARRRGGESLRASSCLSIGSDIPIGNSRASPPPTRRF